MSFIRAHGINGSTLWDVTRASLVAQLLYASPAWWGYLKVSGWAKGPILDGHDLGAIWEIQWNNCMQMLWVDMLPEGGDAACFQFTVDNKLVTVIIIIMSQYLQ